MSFRELYKAAKDAYKQNKSPQSPQRESYGYEVPSQYGLPYAPPRADSHGSWNSMNASTGNIPPSLPPRRSLPPPPVTASSPPLQNGYPSNVISTITPPLSTTSSSQSPLHAYNQMNLPTEQMQALVITPATSPMSSSLALPSRNTHSTSPAPAPFMTPQHASTAPQAMSREAVPGPPATPKILCLDGGGVRGLSEIIMLKFLMDRLNSERDCDLQPWQEFDMIVGTSTGGIIAIMLGRLRMSVQECLDAYCDLMAKVFTPSRHVANLPGKAYDFVRADGRFDHQPLEQAVKDILRSRGLSEDELMAEKPQSEWTCKVAVCAVSEVGTATRIRSYKCEEHDELLRICKIWEAVRATSAASTFFDPITIDGLKYVDGGFRYNNPVDVAYRESLAFYPEREDRIIVSLGTGLEPPLDDITKNVSNLNKAMIGIVTATEEANTSFRDGHMQMVNERQFYRFNVASGLAQIGLQEHKAQGTIKAVTYNYLQTHGDKLQFRQCAKVLVESGQRLNYIGGEKLAAYQRMQAASNIDAAVCHVCNIGLKFNVRTRRCLECFRDICDVCMISHPIQHRASIISVTNVVWQSKMPSYAPSAKCTLCLDDQRVRLNCIDCNFNVDSKCFKTSVEAITEHAKLGHREFVDIHGPWEFKRSVQTRGCPCRQDGLAVWHCGSCLRPVRIGETMTECKTCQLDYGGGIPLCANCAAAISPEHRQAHTFYTLTWAESNMSIAQGQGMMAQCNDCSQLMDISQNLRHEHLSFTIPLPPPIYITLRLEMFHVCEKQAKLKGSRPEPTDPVGGPKCTYCARSVGWYEEGNLLCLDCVACFCCLCISEGVTGHIHPLQPVVYQKKKVGAVDIRQMSCDGCGQQYFFSVYQGLQCLVCRNYDICLECLKKAGQEAGRLMYGASRRWKVHGCRAPQWALVRF